MKKQLSYIILPILAACSALNYSVFVYPNSFAPSGIDGICTMIQYLTDINIGYLSLIINVPLLFAAYFLIDRQFVIKTAIYILAFSAASLFFKHIDLSLIVYHTESGTSIVLAPLTAGVIRGLLYAATLKLHGSSGGVDIIAAIVKWGKPHLELMNVIFIFNICVALSSYFVYGLNPEPVICGIIYSFVTTTITKSLQAKQNETVKIEIITSQATELCKSITGELHQSATIVDAHGAYSAMNKKMVICVTKKEIVPKIENLVSKIPDAVIFESVVRNSMKNG